MIENKDFIVFSDDWGRHPFSCQHLMRCFLGNNRLLWVNTIGLRNPTLSLYDFKRIAGKFKGWFSKNDNPGLRLPENLTVISPFMVPYNQLGLLRRANCRRVVSDVLNASANLGFREPIIVATVPNAADYLGHLNESLAVYYCVDEFSEWPGVCQDLVRRMERRMLSGVDFVAAVSDRLQASKKAAKGPTHLLTHGVDADHFSKVRESEPAPFYQSLKGPVVGYFGLIDERMDLGVIEALLESKPGYNVVLIGTTQVSLDRLERFPNFFHLSPVPYEELPSYAAGFDVAIIPYHINLLSENINPLKLKEYMAAGVPIISTPLPEAVKFDHVIQIARSKQEFVSATERALAEGAPSEQEAALNGETWWDKAELLSGWISQALSQKQQGTVTQ